VKIVIERSLWAKSGTWNLPDKPNCIGGHVMNACGFPMNQYMDVELRRFAEEILVAAYFAICKERDMDIPFQEESKKLNDDKDEVGLQKLFATKGVELVFKD